MERYRWIDYIKSPQGIRKQLQSAQRIRKQLQSAQRIRKQLQSAQRIRKQMQPAQPIRKQLQLEQPIEKLRLLNEPKTLTRNKKKAIFHCKTGGYNPNQDALHQLPRHQQTTIFRLRTDHCRLNSHLKSIGVKTSAQCPCGEADQTPEHYLQSCSLHQQAK